MNQKPEDVTQAINQKQHCVNSPIIERLFVYEAASILGVNVATLRRWEAKGQSPYGKIPTRHFRYFLRAEIEQLAVQRKLIKAKRLAQRSGTSRLIRIPIMTKKEQD